MKVRAWEELTMSDPGQSAPVTSLTYYLTEACNLRCTYCYLEKRPQRSNLEVAKGAIDFLIRESGANRNIHLRFFGGEPLLELDLIKDTVAYGRERAGQAGKNIRFDMVSNGTLLDRETVDALKALGVDVITSVDGSRETMQANRPFHNQKQTFDGFDEKLRYAVAADVGKVARMTVSPNQTDIIPDIKHLLSLGYKSIMISLATNVPWKQETIEGIYRDIAAFYIETARNGLILPLKATNELLVTKHEIKQGKHFPREHGFCAAGKEMLGVSPSGELYPCHRFVQLGAKFRLGSIFGGVEAEKRKVFLEVTTQTLHHEMCNTCHARPYCPGSCMAANFLATGDTFYPENRHCLDLRAHVKAVDRIYDTLVGEGCEVFSSFLERGWVERRKRLLTSLVSESTRKGHGAPMAAGG